MSNFVATNDQRERRAASRNLEIVDPLPTELFLDIDCEADLAYYERLLPLLQQHLECVEIARWQSQSATEGHWHILCRTKICLSDAQRIALQAALGSDRKRELFSILRVIHQSDVSATAFFETPDRAAWFHTEKVRPTLIVEDDDIPF